MKSESWLKSLTSEEVFDRIHNSDQYPFSEFNIQDFETWLELVVDRPAYYDGYNDAKDNYNV